MDMLKNEFGDTVYSEVKNLYLRLDTLPAGSREYLEVVTNIVVESTAHRCLVWHAVGHLLRSGLSSHTLREEFDNLHSLLVLSPPQCLDVGLTGMHREVYFTVLLAGASAFLRTLETAGRPVTVMCDIAFLRERLEERAFSAGEAGAAWLTKLVDGLARGDAVVIGEIAAFLREGVAHAEADAEETIWGSAPDIYSTEVAQA